MIHSTSANGLRRLVPVLALASLVACDDDGGLLGGERLTPEDVSAIYEVCDLSFDPAGSTLPTVDIRAKAFETDGTGTDPQIAIDREPKIFELTYVPDGQLTDRELRGTYELRSLTIVELRFNSSGVSPTPLLIPENRPLQFEFTESPQALTLGASVQYNVARNDYVALSGSDPAGLADQIPGVLVARFQRGGC
jgi:hypothetical protein